MDWVAVTTQASSIQELGQEVIPLSTDCLLDCLLKFTAALLDATIADVTWLQQLY
jgi:hypothetical protein